MQVRTRTMTQPTNMSDSDSGRAAQSMMPALLLGMAAFLTNFDVTAVVIALPTVARELGFDVTGYAWVMDAYSLAFTACLLFAGRWRIGMGGGGRCLLATASLPSHLWRAGWHGTDRRYCSRAYYRGSG